MKNKFNIDDKVIYEGELYTISGIDKMNGYIVYKIDPIEEDGKEYVVSEEDIYLLQEFKDLNKDDLLKFIKTYDNYIEICFALKQKPLTLEQYYNSKEYISLMKEKTKIILSSKLRNFLDEYKEKDNKKIYKKQTFHINDIVKNKITGKQGTVILLFRNNNMVYICYDNENKKWEQECDLEIISTKYNNKTFNKDVRLHYGDEVLNINTHMEGTVEAVSRNNPDRYFVCYGLNGVWEDRKTLLKINKINR